MSSPDGIAVDDKGNIEWVVDKVRASLQGEQFWRDQLSKVDDRIQSGENALIELPQIHSKHLKKRETAESSLEEFYSKHPDARPSETKHKANQLRNQADKLERQEGQKYFLRVIKQQIEENRRIKSVIIQRLKD